MTIISKDEVIHILRQNSAWYPEDDFMKVLEYIEHTSVKEKDCLSCFFYIEEDYKKRKASPSYEPIVYTDEQVRNALRTGELILIDHTGFSQRLKNIFYVHGLYYVDELLKCDFNSFRCMKGLGKTCLSEIRDKLALWTSNDN